MPGPQQRGTSSAAEDETPTQELVISDVNDYNVQIMEELRRRPVVVLEPTG